MNNSKGRYKVSFEEGGCSYKSFTNSIDEAVKYAYEKELVSDHQVIIYDTRKNKTIFPLEEINEK